MAPFERALALLDHVERRAATRTEEWAGGTAFFNSNFPIKYSQNFLRLEPDAQLSVPEIVAEADRVQGGAGLVHRRVNGFGSNLGELVEGFRGQGWEAARQVVMVHDGKVRPVAKQVPVEQVTLAGVRSAMIRWDLEESQFTLAVAEQLADSRGPLEEAGLVDFFSVSIDDTVAGWCELWRYEEVAQVENVMTFPAFRNRGVASSAVTRALEVAYAGGAEIAFLIADDDDWPKQLYARLGFSPGGNLWEFTLPAP